MTFELVHCIIQTINFSHMKIKFSSLIVALIVGAALVSCSTIKYTTDFDGSADFQSYKTFQYYGWAEESNKIINTIDQDRIESAFGAELDKRGLEYVKENGDLIITLYIVTQEKTQTTANTTTSGGMGGGYYGYGGSYGYGPAYGWGPTSSHTTYSEYDYTVGTLIIDVYDAKDKKLVWESVSTGTINEKTKGREERIQSTVGKMMLKYPVEPLK